jgi:citrate synthase
VAKLMSQVRTIAAYSYRKSHGLPLIYPKKSLQIHGELPAHAVLDAV